MTLRWRIFIIGIIHLVLSLVTCEQILTQEDKKINVNINERVEPTRYLVFPQGSNVQLVYCMTIGTFAKPETVFTMGVTAGLAYELPHKNSIPYRKPAEVYHRRSRRDLYKKIEVFLNSQGKNGSCCILKALCEAGKRDATQIGKGTFIQEILHAVFTLPRDYFDEELPTTYEEAFHSTAECYKLYPNCLDAF